MSPIFVAVVAFCFSMTIGVLWEFFEFFCDVFFQKDMQKDFVINSIVSTFISGNTKEPAVIENVKSLVINGEQVDIGGYLDIGLYDTMKDLLVNFIGAAGFSVFGFLYIKYRGKNKIAAQFIPVMATDKEKEKVEENED